MNLVELYQQTPVEEHQNIKVAGDRVVVIDTGGNIAEYILLEDGELLLVRSEKEQKQDIKAIKSKLDIFEV